MINLVDPTLNHDGTAARPAQAEDLWPEQSGRIDTAIHNVWQTVKVHRWRGLGFGLALFSCGVLAALGMENSYRSEATLFVKLGRESVSLDPTVTVSPMVPVSESRESEVNSILEVLQNRELAERVVDALGPEAILSGQLPTAKDATGDDMPSEPSQVSRWIGATIDRLREFNDGRVVSPRERAVTRVQRNLSVQLPRKTSVLNLTYEAKTPELAQTVLAKLVDLFLQEHVRINRTSGSHDFLTEQTDLLRAQLNEADARLTETKNETGIVTIEGARRKLQDELALISQQMIQNQTELSGVESRVASLAGTIAKLPERTDLAQVSGIANEANDRMRDALYQLQIREKEMASRMSDAHPLLVQMRRQLAEAEEIYHQQSLVREQTTSDLNPVRQGLVLSLMTENATLAALRGRLDQLAQSRDTAQVALRQLNEDAVRVAALERESGIAEQAYKMYSDRLEQARLDQELRSQRISNVNVLQAANYREKPASPARLLILAASLVGACLGGCGFTLLWDVIHPAVKTTSDIERVLAVRVMASLPSRLPQAPTPSSPTPARERT